MFVKKYNFDTVMSEIHAKVSKLTGEVRCGLPDCNLLLAKNVKHANIEIKCKCGVVNVVIAEPPQFQRKPDGPGLNGNASYQDRLNINKKAG